MLSLAVKGEWESDFSDRELVGRAAGNHVRNT